MNELQKALVGASAAAPPDHILEFLTEEQAHVCPQGAPHGIYAELWHLAFWQQISIEWVEGIETPIPEHAADGFPSEAEIAGEAWPELCRRFLDGAQRAAAIAGEEHRLEDEIVCPSPAGQASRKMSVRDQLISLAAHNAYHLGRIVLLRQLIGAWPPPSGGFTW